MLVCSDSWAPVSLEMYFSLFHMSVTTHFRAEEQEGQRATFLHLLFS